MFFFCFFFCLGGPKLLQLQNLGGCFVVFFLGGQNRNFGKVRGLKLQLSLLFTSPMFFILTRLSRSGMMFSGTTFSSSVARRLGEELSELMVSSVSVARCLGEEPSGLMVSSDSHDPITKIVTGAQTYTF